MQVKEAMSGVDHDGCVHVRGANVGPIVEERERKEDVGMCPKGAPLKVKKATTTSRGLRSGV